MSRRSRANPWWERCDMLGHECRWCCQAEARAVHLGMASMVLPFSLDWLDEQVLVVRLPPYGAAWRADSLVEIAERWMRGK